MGATTAESLAIEIGANSAPLIREFQKASKSAEKQLNEITRSLDKTQKRIDKFTSQKMKSIQFGGIGGNLGNLANTAIGALAVRQVGVYAEAWQNVSNKLLAMGRPAEFVQGELNQLADIADRSRGSFNGVADLYAKLTMSSKQLGLSQNQIAVMTETISKSFVLSGASAQQAEAGILQLGQALASGRLQGDEFRSLMENAPDLMNRLAASLGVGIGALKDMASEGKLTSEVISGALIGMADGVNAAFSKTTASMGQSYEQLEAKAIKLVGNSNLVKAATGGVVDALQLLKNNLEEVGIGLIALGAILAGKFLAGAAVSITTSLIAPFKAVRAEMIATQLAAASNLPMIASIGTTASLAAVGVNTLKTAFSFMGGAVGVGITIAMFAIQAFASKNAEAARKTKELQEAVEEATRTNYTFADSAAKAVQAPREIAIVQGELTQALTSTKDAQDGLSKSLDYYIGLSKDNNPELEQHLIRIKEKLDGTEQGFIAASRELDSLNAANPSFAGVLAGLIQIKNKAIEAVRAVVKLKAESNVASNASIQDAAAANPAAGIGQGLAKSAPSFGKELDAQNEISRIQNYKNAVLSEANLSKDAKEIRDRTNEIVENATTQGIVLGIKDAEALARKAIAAEDVSSGKGGGGAEKESDFQKLMDNLEKERIAIDAEANSVGLLNSEKRASLEIAKLGIASDSQEAAKIREKAAAIEASKQKLAEYNAQKESVRQLGETFTDALADIVINGKKANDVFKGLVKTLANDALRQLLNGGKSGAGGLFGGILNILGSFGKPAATGLPIPLLLPGHSSGGYTGNTGVNQVAGVVHGQEFVVNASATKQYMPLLKAINSGKTISMGGGGAIGVSRSGGAVSTNNTMQVTINAPGADSAQLASVRAELQNLQKTFGQRVAMANRQTNVRNVRP